MTEIKPYIKVRSKVNGFDFYHFLNIQGGPGHGKREWGGRFLFTVAYLSPADQEAMGMTSPEIFCKESHIPFGAGDTIEEAYAMFEEQLKKIPLK